MNKFDSSVLKQLYKPGVDSHKGQNGKLLLIGGSKLFHAASLWSLQVASRIVDMVFYASVPENNELVEKAKEEFRNGIVIPRSKIEDYVKESECILIGPGLMRTDEPLAPTEDYNMKDLSELDEIGLEGIQTYYLTKYLLTKYKDKKFVIDGGSLQMMDPKWLMGFKEMPIVTPHHGEFETLFGVSGNENTIVEMARKYNVVILAKGEKDIVCSASQCVEIEGGNAGMTKGGTGDVLAGLVAALYCKNDAFLSAAAASYINKKAGDSLFERVGPYFNASDLASEIPKVMNILS